MKKESRNIWLFNKPIDLGLLFVPVWLIWIICFALPEEIIQTEVSIWVWLIFVIGIDVSHVWSTIFRTYADKEEFKNHKKLLLIAPVVAFLLFFLISGFSQLLFWRVLAYIALYHFIKQQYGFMRIYKAKAKDFTPKKIKDEWVIYIGMIYPVVFWHLTDQRNFSWFVDGDFLNYYQFLADFQLDSVFMITHGLYWLLIICWLVQEIKLKSVFLYGKVLWILTTAINWYIGIVYFNSDLVFTITNIVAHGIPYLVLVLFYVERKKTIKPDPAAVKVKRAKLWMRISLMLTIVLILAFGEEYFWDMLIYRERTGMFESFIPFPMEAFSSRWWQAFGIALLTIPQATHYIIDGFIWKSGSKNPYLKRVLMNE